MQQEDVLIRALSLLAPVHSYLDTNRLAELAAHLTEPIMTHEELMAFEADRQHRLNADAYTIFLNMLAHFDACTQEIRQALSTGDATLVGARLNWLQAQFPALWRQKDGAIAHAEVLRDTSAPLPPAPSLPDAAACLDTLAANVEKYAARGFWRSLRAQLELDLGATRAALNEAPAAVPAADGGFTVTVPELPDAPLYHALIDDYERRGYTFAGRTFNDVATYRFAPK